MSRIKQVSGVAAVWALLSGVAVTAPVAAQSSATASIAATASVVGVAPLTATGVADLDFGVIPAGAPSTPANLASQAGRFDLTGEPDAPIIVTFTLPSVLTGPGGDIPIAFGAADGLEWVPFPAAFNAFDPNVPFMTALNGAGNATIGISGTVDPPAATTTGTYTGTIVLTVAY